VFKNVEIVTLYGKGRTGLSNLGNTCYLNSILQCLSSETKLLEYFLTNNYKNELNQSDGIAHEFSEIVNAIWKSHQQIISPIKLRSLIGNTNENFYSNNQQDSHELLIFLLEALHKELNRVRI
jgi:ubiquitin C-terminal hydrolase